MNKKTNTDKELHCLLDTAFLINLVNENAPFHVAAKQYFEDFMRRGYKLYVSTIALSEYGVGDNISNLPLSVIRIVPFNYGHAVKAGDFGAHTNLCRKNEQGNGTSRSIVSSDSKMFAQAEVEKFDYFISADTKAIKPYQWLLDHNFAHFQYLDITKIPIHEFYNELPFDEQ